MATRNVLSKCGDNSIVDTDRIRLAQRNGGCCCSQNKVVPARHSESTVSGHEPHHCGLCPQPQVGRPSFGHHCLGRTSTSSSYN